MDPQQSPRRLFRSNTDRVIAGVCGGLAEYLHVDSTIVRLFFVLFTLVGGSGLILYIIMAIIIPPKGDMPPIDRKEKIREFVEKATDTVKETAEEIRSNVKIHDWSKMYIERRRRRALYAGLVFVVIGALLLLKNVFPDYWFWVRGDVVWPILFIFIGVYFITRPRY